MLRNCTRFLSLLAILNACSSIKDSPKYQLSDGIYEFKQSPDKYRKAFVYVNDTVSIFLKENPKERFTTDKLKDQFFRKRSFDIDVMTIPFKYRPATGSIPRQLTTDFNGNIFIGYRIDRFRVSYTETPVGWKQSGKHRAFSIGGFGGLGSTSVTSSTTNNQSTDEYSGVILTRGLAAMIGVNNLTVGVGIGWDYLTDRDKGIWIYQNKSWYGLTVGLNLN